MFKITDKQFNEYSSRNTIITTLHLQFRPPVIVNLLENTGLGTARTTQEEVYLKTVLYFTDFSHFKNA